MTNAISAWISRSYFDEMVGAWYGRSMSWTDVVEQGLIESTLFGIALAAVVTLTYIPGTRCRLPLRAVAAALAVGVGIALACWTIGGLAGAMWTWIAPRSFVETFPCYEETRVTVARWAFVGGSIWGVYAGGVAAMLSTCVVIVQRWNRLAAGALWPG